MVRVCRDRTTITSISSRTAGREDEGSERELVEGASQERVSEGERLRIEN